MHNQNFFKLTPESEGELFQSANEIIFKEKNEKQTSLLGSRYDADHIQNMKGAIVLSYSKEAGGQIYSTSRKLDVLNRLMHNRPTSSLQMKSPIVEFLTPDVKKGEKEMSEDEMFKLSLANVINNSSSTLSDIFYSTPIVMNHILDHKRVFSPFDINPKTIIIDEFDEMMNNSRMNLYLHKILSYFGYFGSDESS